MYREPVRQRQLAEILVKQMGFARVEVAERADLSSSASTSACMPSPSHATPTPPGSREAFYFDAFSSREPVPTSLENALLTSKPRSAAAPFRESLPPAP